jgi:hypothetical protein
MQKVKIEATIPVFFPLPFEGIDDYCEETESQILAIESSIVPHWGEETNVKITKLSNKRQTDLGKKFFKFRHLRRLKLFSFELSANYDIDKISLDSEDALKAVAKADLFYSLAATELEFFIYRLVFAANLARPGTFAFDESIILVNGNYYKSFHGLRNEFNVLYSSRRKTKWPKIEFLDIAGVWAWLKKHEDFNHAFGHTPFGRTLSAFSFLFYQDPVYSEPLDDLWALVGLESIYKSNGSKKTLLEKIELFLGKNKRLKAVIDDLYKVRSTLIHGSMNLPLLFCPFDASDAYAAYMHKATRFEETSRPILIATLQKMYLLNLYDIAFEYRLKT